MHFENNLDFKATHEFYLENQGRFQPLFQRTVLAHFENNLDFKATHEFYLENQGGF